MVELDPVLSLSLEVRGWNCGEADEEGKQEEERMN